MSHSAIFQLYSDGTVAQFPNFDLLPGTQCYEQLGVFSVPSLPGHRDVRRRLLYLLAIRGPTRGEGMPGIEPGSPDPQSSPATSTPTRRAGYASDHGIFRMQIDKIIQVHYIDELKVQK